MIFSIIIVNFNGKKPLEQCLDSILNITLKNFEVIVVDNCSTDDSIKFIKQKYKTKNDKLKIVKLNQNYGPAKARNEGVKHSSGKFLCFLDNDTQVDINWVNEALKLFNKDIKIGCIQSKLLLENNHKKFDYAGDYLNQYGLLSHRATYGDIDKGQHEKEVPIFAAKSAGMFIRKDVFNKIKGFDPDYFIYMEETDLCWRSWLVGYKSYYCPKSIVYHGYSGSFKLLKKSFANYNLRFHGTKNYIQTIIKNLELNNLIKILPKQVLIFFCFSLYFLFQGKIKDFLYINKGIIWNLINIKKIFKKRNFIQKNRVMSDNQLFKYIFIKEKLINKIRKSILLNTKNSC